MSRSGLKVQKPVVQATLHHRQISALTNGPICHDNSGSKGTKVLQAVQRELSLLIRLNVRQKKEKKNKVRFEDAQIWLSNYAVVSLQP